MKTAAANWLRIESSVSSPGQIKAVISLPSDLLSTFQGRLHNRNRKVG